MRALAILEKKTLNEALLEIVEKYFPEYTPQIYFSKQVVLLFKENHSIPDFVFIEGYSNKDFQSLIRDYSNDTTKIVCWIPRLEEAYLKSLFKLNLDGYFYYTMTSNEVINAINIMLNGNTYIHHQFTSTLIKDFVRLTYEVRKQSKELLSKREFEILELIVKGYKVKSIAKFLQIAPSTVNNHIAKILIKLQVPDKTNAVLFAIRKNWFTLEDKKI